MRGFLPEKTEIPQLLGAPGAFIRAYRWPLVVLACGAMADVVTTLVNLRRYGPDVEAHLVQRWVSQVVGVEAGVPLAKVLQLSFVIAVAAWWRPWTGWLMALCGLLYAGAAVSNHYLWL